MKFPPLAIWQMGCLLLSPWGTARNALVYFWHLHKWFLAGVIGGKAFTLYHRQSVLSLSTTLTNHRCLCPRLQVSASLRSQTSTCRNFTPEEKNPLTSLYRIIILGNTITVNIKIKNASWESFRWEIRVGEWWGHPAVFWVGGDLAVTSVTIDHWGKFEWSDLSLCSLLPNLFPSCSSLQRFLHGGHHPQEGRWPFSQSSDLRPGGVESGSSNLLSLAQYK